ncbi:NYN domain-containing protein [Thermovenabulum sp.]|uniref:NYN domain-containing protein n=1 Tax=Thermovenabulum sp. TaxID=3100335 RepID=UPI003C7C3066
MLERPEEVLFVDGYNIINAWPNLQSAKEIDLETARQKLVDIMSEYSALTGVKVKVVFDAHMVEGGRRIIENINGVEVVYTKERETADNYIEKMVESYGKEAGKDYRVRVATSDFLEQRIVLGKGAIRVSARELFYEVNRIFEERRKKEKIMKFQKETLADRLDETTLKSLINRIKGCQA